jgi:hypothetical protein
MEIIRPISIYPNKQGLNFEMIPIIGKPERFLMYCDEMLVMSGTWYDCTTQMDFILLSVDD